MSITLSVVSGAVALYLGALGYLYTQQENFIFPADKMNKITPYAPIEGEEEVQLTMADGKIISGRLFAAEPGNDVILGFSGNAHNPIGYTRFLHQTFPNKTVMTFFYRGYGPSEGEPSQQKVLEDAETIYNYALTRFQPQRVIVAGVSLGSSVAAHLVNTKKVDAQILVVPFTSVAELAAQKYPYFPVKSLVKHPFNTLEQVQQNNIPTAVIIAGDDQIVPAENTAQLLKAIPNLQFTYTEPNVGHGALLNHPAMGKAMQQAFEAITQK